MLFGTWAYHIARRIEAIIRPVGFIRTSLYRTVNGIIGKFGERQVDGLGWG